MRVSRRLGAGFALLLSACTVGPPSKSPPLPTFPPGGIPLSLGATIAVHSDPDPKWWGTFNDPVLDDLIKKAIAGNLDVQQAVLRVVKSRQSVVAAQAAGLPRLGANASYMREQLGAKGILESQGVYRNLNNLADHLQPLGLSAFIQVLDAERTLELQRQQLVQADVQLVNDVVALYRVLGGGWEQSAGDVKAPSVPELLPIAPAALDSVAAPATPTGR